MDTMKIAKEIISLLKLENIEAYIEAKSKYSSVYVRFENANMLSMRIADHKGYEWLSYRWNIRTYMTGWEKVIDKNDMVRYYFGPDHIPTLINMLVERRDLIKNWPVRKYNKRRHQK